MEFSPPPFIFVVFIFVILAIVSITIPMPVPHSVSNKPMNTVGTLKNIKVLSKSSFFDLGKTEITLNDGTHIILDGIFKKWRIGEPVLSPKDDSVYYTKVYCLKKHCLALDK